MLDKLKSDKGFTLIEVIIALCLSLMVMGAVYSTYITHNESSVVQGQVAEMQQNLRAAVYMMEKEIRMAGFNPTGKNPNPFGITTAATNSITFAVDFNGDGALDADETITYSIPAGTTDLTRTVGVAAPVSALLAENIQALGFAYAFDDNDDDDALETSPANNIIWAIDNDGDPELEVNLDTFDDGYIDTNDNTAGATFTGSPVALADIRGVKIWVLARARTQDVDYNDARTYVVANTQITPNDTFRRRLLTTTIICRNMGMGL